MGQRVDGSGFCHAEEEFERLLVSLDGSARPSCLQVSQKVGSLNERREVGPDRTSAWRRSRLPALRQCRDSPAGKGRCRGYSGTAGGCFKTFTSLTGDALLPGSTTKPSCWRTRPA